MFYPCICVSTIVKKGDDYEIDKRRKMNGMMEK